MINKMICWKCIVLLFLVILCAECKNTTEPQRFNVSDYETSDKERSEITAISLVREASTSWTETSVLIEDNVGSIIREGKTIKSTIGLTTNNEFFFSQTPTYDRLQSSTLSLDKNLNALTTSLRSAPTHSTTTLLEDDCFQYTKCKPDNMKHWYCGCDDMCQEFNDCCYPSNVTASTVKTSKYMCMNKRGPDFAGIAFRGFFVIGKCAIGDSVLQGKCYNDDFLETGPPVVSKGDKMKIFKNKYCALCNNMTNFIFFDIAVMISKLDSMYESELNKSNTNLERIKLLLRNNVKYEYIPPKEAEIRTCSVSMVENDNPSCQRYNSPVLVTFQGMGYDFVYFRNIFCSQLTEIEISFLNCIASFYEIAFGSESGFIQQLSVIFSFTEQNGVQNEQSSCDKWTPEMQEKGLCSNELSVINVEEDLEYYMKVDENSTDTHLKQLVFLTIWVKSIPNIGYIRGRTKVKITKKVLKIETQMTVVKRSFLSEVPRIVQNFRKQKVHIFVKKDHTYYSVEITHDNHTQEQGERTLFFYIDNVAKMFQYNKIVLPTDIVIKEFCSDITIIVKYLDDDYVQVETVSCKNTSETPRNVSILAILTYIFCGISVISLIILFLCYRKNKLYTDVPSSNLENIAISMMAANILFLCGIGATKLQKVCYAVSIALHYVWLASFSFTSLAVIYIVSTLLKMRARRIISKEVKVKQRRTFTLVGLLIPILFVVPAVVTDQYGPEYLSPGYGNLVCFPTKFPGNLIFFSGPVMVSILINSVCLITVMIKLHVVTTGTKQIRQSSTYRQGKVFLRLITLSGVLWITGIFAVLFRSEWLDYAFTFLCGLHGFFLCVANLTTLRVSRPRNNSTNTT